MKIYPHNGAVVVEVDPAGPWSMREELTAHEAERMIKQLRKVIDEIRNAVNKPRKLGDY